MVHGESRCQHTLLLVLRNSFPSQFHNYGTDCAGRMASFEVATKANLASVLPSLLVATHLQRQHSSLLPHVFKSFHDGATLTGKDVIQMSLRDGKVLTGFSIVRYLGELANNDSINTDTKHASSVRIILCTTAKTH